MSKIFDALRKASGEQVPREETLPEAASVPVPVPLPAPAQKVVEEVSQDEPSPPALNKPGYEAADDLPDLDPDTARELSALRANVEQILPASAPRTLLFAGSMPGEGASTVAARFAQYLSEDHRLRVALVDSDLRNRDSRPVEPVDPGTGFASVLSGELAVADGLRPAGRGGLEVLPSEGTVGDPYALCTAEHLHPFMDHLQAHYHYGLLDAAPVLSAPETAVLATMVDGVVLVVRAGRTKREVVKLSLDRLAKQGARVLGVVMNRQQYVIPSFIYRRL